MPKNDSKNNKRRVFIAINLVAMDAMASFTKQEIADYLGVHRNTVVFENKMARIKDYLILDREITFRNPNMVRNVDNFKNKKHE